MRAMQESGVPWIGEIPEVWHTTQAKRVVSISNGSNPQTEGDVPVFGSGLNSFRTCGEYKEGAAVLVGRKGTLNAPRYVEGKYWNVDTAFDVRTQNEQFILKYYYYLSICFDYQLYMTSTALPSMTQSNYGTMLLPVPPKDIQIGIIQYLDVKCAQIDTIIAKQWEVIEKLKDYEQEMISKAVRQGIRKAPLTKSRFFWIDETPVHWKIGQLKFFANIRSGLTLGKKYSADEELVEIPYLRVANVQKDHVDLTDVASVRVLPSEVDRYLLHVGELLMTEGGDRDKLGRGCIWQGEIPQCLHQNHVFAVTTDQTHLDIHYLDYVTRSDIGRNYFDYTAKKTTNLASTNSTTILEFRLPIPPIEEQQEIVEYIMEKCARISRLLSQHQAFINKLTEFKKALIYEVVTGKKDVRNAARTALRQPNKVQAITQSSDRENAVLMAEILGRLGKDAKGRTHVIKCMHAIACMTGVLSATQYVRQKYGPYDVRIGEYESIIKQNKWFSIAKGGKIRYTKGARLAECRAEYKTLFSANDKEIRRIVTFFKPMSAAKAGRVGTLLGVWNDFILDGIPKPTDTQLIEEARTNWTENKESIPVEKWQATLDEMKAKNIVPCGLGLHTITKEHWEQSRERF